MGSSDKFCLRWNDFESNISTSFRDLRVNQDFFDVSLAVEGDVVKAHKVILAACSPFFHNVLAKQNVALPYGHPHPVIYLRGIKLHELRHVLDFMYHGEVNVAQDDLNNFLAVAEDLQIKGLTQDGDKIPPSSFQKSQRSRKEGLKRGDPPDRGENGPPIKKRTSNIPPPIIPQVDDDDVQDVTPVKQENSSDLKIEDAPFGAAEAPEEFGDAGEEDFGQYEGEAYADPQPGTSDGSKGFGDGKIEITKDSLDIHLKAVNGGFVCLLCGKVVAIKNNAVRHVKEIHTNIEKDIYVCPVCQRFYNKRRSFQNHINTQHVDLKGLNVDSCIKKDWK